MNDMSCSLDTCYLDLCPKIKTLEPPVTFFCDRCGDKPENARCYVTQENKKICSTCIDSITMWDALIFIGCLVI